MADVILRETSVIGVVGGFGLGWQLLESISSFAWLEISIIIITYSTITIIWEIISEKIKNFWLEKNANDYSVK